MGNKGFSLIELVLAVVIIGVSSMGLVAIMQQVLLNIHKPLVIATATGLAEEEMESMMVMSFSGITTQSSKSFTGNLTAYSYSVAVTSIDANDKEVVVTVNHPVIGNLQLAFIRTNF